MKEFLADFALFIQAIEAAMIAKRPDMAKAKLDGYDITVADLSPVYTDDDGGEYISVQVSQVHPKRDSNPFGFTFGVTVDVSDIEEQFDGLKAAKMQRLAVPVSKLAVGFRGLELH